MMTTKVVEEEMNQQQQHQKAVKGKDMKKNQPPDLLKTTTTITPTRTTKLLLVGFVLILLLPAIGIGYVGRYCPHLFLRYFPNHGYKLWVLSSKLINNNNIYPIPYFDTQPYHKDHFHKWIQDGDVIISSSPKSGTIWMTNIVHLLLHNGQDDTYDYLQTSNYIGFHEMKQYPGQPVEERLNITNQKRINLSKDRSDTTSPTSSENNKQKKDMMIHFSHTYNFAKDTDGDETTMYGLNPTFHPTVKYIVQVRNGKEVLNSAIHFMNSHTSEFRKLFGGFPPPIHHPKEGT